MSPDQISIINTIALILDKVGTWPVGTIFTVITLGPWAMMYFIARGQDKRFEAVAKMYENNVELVNNYQDIAKDLHDTVVYNTTIMTQVKDIADHNLYCPLVRKKTKQSEVDG
ncbi:MAG: hypothetical protein HZA14_12415 [Nitrospirae bacterium]|nr:hypothetical protein [Nitrospirota bacterium]